MNVFFDQIIIQDGFSEFSRNAFDLQLPSSAKCSTNDHHASFLSPEVHEGI